MNREGTVVNTDKVKLSEKIIKILLRVLYNNRVYNYIYNYYLRENGTGSMFRKNRYWLAESYHSWRCGEYYWDISWLYLLYGVGLKKFNPSGDGA